MEVGIPTVVDRVIQQAMAQVLSKGYESYFSEYSYGFRPNRDCHKAIEKVLEYLNEGYEYLTGMYGATGGARAMALPLPYFP